MSGVVMCRRWAITPRYTTQALVDLMVWPEAGGRATVSPLPLDDCVRRLAAALGDNGHMAATSLTFENREDGRTWRVNLTPDEAARMLRELARHL